jgi:hypothetical protein
MALSVAQTHYLLFKRDVSVYTIKRILKQQSTLAFRDKCLEKIMLLKDGNKGSFTGQCEKYAATIWEIPAMANEDRDAARM